MNGNNDTTEFRELCYRCCRPVKACFCKHIEPFPTVTRFCLLMHPKEAKLSHIGTGRMAKGALENSEIIIGENFDQNERVNHYLNHPDFFPLMLYPGEQAINISEENLGKDILKGKTPLIFILDGTWPCAKSMFRDSKCLHTLPRISFSQSQESRYLIRHQPAKFCLSTIESIYFLIKNLERINWENVGDKKECMLVALDKLVQFHLDCAADPNLKSYKRNRGTFKKPIDRVASKRWEHRKVCFEDRNYSHKKDNN